MCIRDRSTGIPQIDQGQVVTMLYLKVSISDFLTLFAARTGADWFWAYRPSPVLFWGAVGSLTISTCVAAFWPDQTMDDIITIGLSHGDSTAVKLLPLWVWLYCIFWWFLQDAAKVATYKFLDHYDIFSYRTEALTSGPDPHPQRRRSRGMSIGGNIDEPLIKSQTRLRSNSWKSNH
eukprot:TRINITY_DN7863_c0_g1_i5.p1 TRINITY_DN7863_c0_g1~~TRINITY_DN7863_c0_g1_i5.p1  ORF type:complete len:177 (+),score=39.10 TRINITY_DN7863_c0_g1_i5:107-637(+)